MQPLQLLLPALCAARESTKLAHMNVPETAHPAQRLALPPHAPVVGLRPFHHPTDYNSTANDLSGTPEWWLYCSKTPELISPSYIDELVDGSFLTSTINNGSIPNNNGWVWVYLMPEPSTQIYICNYNQMFNFSINVGVFNTVNRWLDEICGEAIAGYVYLDTPWHVAIGRNSTTPNGYPKPECGGQWSPDSGWA